MVKGAFRALKISFVLLAFAIILKGFDTHVLSKEKRKSRYDFTIPKRKHITYVSNMLVIFIKLVKRTHNINYNIPSE